MRLFLSAEPVGDQTYRIAIGSSTEAVARGGLISPVFPAFNAELDELGEATGLLLCFAESPASLLSVIDNQMPRELRSRTMMTYGLASVLLMGNVDELRDIAVAQQALLTAWELWPLSRGSLSEDNIERFIRPAPSVDIQPISTDGLKYDAACQVRQLNVNLAFALYRSSVYTPELVTAFVAIYGTASQLVDKLRPKDDRASSIDEVRNHHHYVSLVLQINAGLSMVISQTLGGVPPLLNSEYPVGEYGLLGIGAAARALWAFYFHLRRCFLDANHGSRLADNADRLAPFDPFLKWDELDYSAWSGAASRLANLPAAEGGGSAPHLIHFSSRFGFHETEYALGASWQSLHASSSREWHLLTVTHEYIHSQVRQLTSAIFPAGTDWDRLSALFKGEKPQNALESMQVALAQGMARYAAARYASASIEAGVPRLVSDGYNGKPAPPEIRETIGNELRYFQEIVVHVLDYLYTFHGRSETYLAAIWQSWSTVPSVTERLHDYLLRSLCALAATSVLPERDASKAFDAVLETAVRDLRALGKTFHSPVVDYAVNYLCSDLGERRLGVEFSQAYYIARFTREFFYDPEVATALRADALTALGSPGDRRYVFGPGEYPDDPVESPLAFLSDRFEHETMDAGEELEHASLWQLLLVTDPSKREW